MTRPDLLAAVLGGERPSADDIRRAVAKVQAAERRAAVVAAALADPAILWEIRRLAPPVMGPWYRTPDWSRRPCDGLNDVGVYQNASADGIDGWYVVEVSIFWPKGLSHERLRGYWPAGTLARHREDTREEAESWCDARLREAGVLLVGDV